MSSVQQARGGQSRGTLTMAICAALLSATGQPAPKISTWLSGLGLPDLAVRAAAHAIPVVLIVAALVIGRMLGRNRSKQTRWIIYALLGGVAGFFTAFCLDLFVGVPVIIEAVNGPLSEPDTTEILLWAFGGLMLIMAVLVAALAAFGSQAAYALNVEEDVCEDAFDIRKPERAAYGLSGVGLVAAGLACIALAVTRQSLPTAVIGPAIVAALSAVVYIATNFMLWARFDELQRRQVISGFSVSAIFATIAAFWWAILEVMQLTPPIDGAAAFLLLIFLQFAAVTYASVSIAGRAPSAITA